MPIIDIHLPLGAFTGAQKQRLVEKITTDTRAIGTQEVARWVRVNEIARGDWGIGVGQLSSSEISVLRGE